MQKQLELVSLMQDKFLKTRLFGAACIDFTNLATNKAQAYICYYNHIWDIAPGLLLAKEAGCVYKTLENTNYTYNDIKPEIMIPLVGDKKELDYVKAVVVKEADKIVKESGIELSYTGGTMIEVPRAALLADEIAKSAEFFSFGTNDLTQMTYGFSRDDAGTFLNDYYSKKIFDFDPFSRIDFDGVGKLIEMATRLGKSTRPNLKVGICGEQGGNPASVEFCHNVGLDYVSCSPYRVPIAILAAAHANIKNPK